MSCAGNAISVGDCVLGLCTPCTGHTVRCCSLDQGRHAVLTWRASVQEAVGLQLKPILCRMMSHPMALPPSPLQHLLALLPSRLQRLLAILPKASVVAYARHGSCNVNDTLQFPDALCAAMTLFRYPQICHRFGPPPRSKQCMHPTMLRQAERVQVRMTFCLFSVPNVASVSFAKSRPTAIVRLTLAVVCVGSPLVGPGPQARRLSYSGASPSLPTVQGHATTALAEESPGLVNLDCGEARRRAARHPTRRCACCLASAKFRWCRYDSQVPCRLLRQIDCHLTAMLCPTGPMASPVQPPFQAHPPCSAPAHRSATSKCSYSTSSSQNPSSCASARACHFRLQRSTA